MQPHRRLCPPSPALICTALFVASACVVARPPVVANPPVAAGAKGPAPEKALPLLSRVILAMDDFYVDRSRLDPKRLFIAALRRLELAVDEVTVREDPAAARVTFTAGVATREFELAELTSIWRTRVFLGEALETLTRGTGPRDDLSDLEHQLIHGMLAALDPRSRFGPAQVVVKGPPPAGLGFVMKSSEGRLVVVRALPGTPAERAGLVAGDVIVAIGDRSAANVSLDEAVDLLRGEVGSKATLTWIRGGERRQATLTREVIPFPSRSVAKLVGGNVAYVRVADFPSGAARKLDKALGRLRMEAGGTLQGMILDLRGNVGGLLDAAVEVADLFLADGVICETRLASHRKPAAEIARAGPATSDLTDTPLVILVDRASASAAELVAAALQENGRAVVFGSRTAGAGTVRQIWEFGEGPAPKSQLLLATARLFTPAGRSIDEGVTPDVGLLPACVEKDAVHAFAPAADTREPQPTGATPSVRFLAAPRDGVKVRECGASSDDALEPFPEQFAREVLLDASAGDRASLLEAAKRAAAGAAEEARLAARLAELGVDWSSGPRKGTPRPVVTMDLSPSRRIAAGETLRWKVTVENRGTGELLRLRAWTSGASGLQLDRREFLFGRVKAGERRSWTLSVKVPEGTPSQRQPIGLSFAEEHGRAPEGQQIMLEVVERPRPHFAIEAAIGPAGAEPSQARSLRVAVRNDGRGASGAGTVVRLGNSDGGIFVESGSAEIGRLDPGAVGKGALVFRRREASALPESRLRLTVLDRELEEWVERDVVVSAKAMAAGSARLDLGWAAPPRIVLAPDPAAGPPPGGERLRLTGTAASASDGGSVRDVVVFANERKVLFQRAADGGTAELAFAAELELEPGDNTIVVMARSVDGLRSRRELLVRR